MNKNLTIVAFLGMLAVVLGAFGAHTLKSKLSAEAINSFETAVRYQMYHVILLLFVNSNDAFSEKMKNAITLITSIGIILFSGSIYLIHLANVPAKSIWFITPLGGVFLIAAWFFVFIFFLRRVIKKV